MLGPSALFNTGYRHGANGDGKEPRQTKRGKEDSAVGCHVGRREFRLQRALCENYATTHSLDRSNPPGRLPLILCTKRVES
eukprot:scaffold152606_cov32-Attheya_sp.AAC.1